MKIQVCLGSAVTVVGGLAMSCSGDTWLIADSDRSFGGNQGEPRILSDQCPELVSERTVVPGCWPTLHVGEWRGFAAKNPFYRGLGSESLPYPEPAIHLSVLAEGQAVWRFGDNEFEVPSSDWACAMDPSGAACGGAGELLPGVPYELRALRMSGAREQASLSAPNVAFNLAVNAPWQAWCETHSDAPSPLCSCYAQGCGAAVNSISVRLSLSSDGQSMRGTARSESGGQVEEARIELLRL